MCPPELNPPAQLTQPDQKDIEEALKRAHLKTASVHGLGLNMAAQMLRFGLQFVYQILIARLLSPSDFGLVALAAPVTAFVGLFADLGLSQATVQRTTISQQQLSFIFWINLSAGLLLAAISIAVSPMVAAFYGDVRVVGVTSAFGSLFVLGGLYTQHLAILNRHMRFTSLVIIDLASFVAGSIVGVSAALSGMGYWSIVANSAATSFASLALAWYISRWKPSRPHWPSDAGAILRFGGDLTGFNIVNYFARNFDNVLIGRVSGEQSLGFYDRAYKLLLLPLNQISAPLSRVAVPLLSRTQLEPALYRRAYLRTLALTLMLTYPGVLFALIESSTLIKILLGQKWLGVSPIFSVLAIAAFVAPISNSTGWLFISQGRVKEMRNTGIISSVLYVLSFVAGLRWGPLGVATAYVAMNVLRIPFIWLSATRSGPVRKIDIFQVIGPCLLSLLITAVPVFIVGHLFGSTIIALIASLLLSYIVFAFMLWIIPDSRIAILDLLAQSNITRIFIKLKRIGSHKRQ